MILLWAQSRRWTKVESLDSPVKSTKLAIAGAKNPPDFFIEICQARFEIMASKFPMATIWQPFESTKMHVNVCLCDLHLG